MRVLMLGWEFPPHISGGLGTACHGLTEALARARTRVLFVLPRAIESLTTAERDETRRRIVLQGGLYVSAGNPGSSDYIEMAAVPSGVRDPYRTAALDAQVDALAQGSDTEDAAAMRRSRDSSVRVVGVGAQGGYDGDLVHKIYDYADRCVRVTRRELFDVIHAHDWMTFPAAGAIAAFSGRPLVVHVHATEFDRTGERVNTAIYEIERRGMHAASVVIAVSERTRRMLIDRYDVPPERVKVIHNGSDTARPSSSRGHRDGRGKVVLFLGRITMQKGPEYFVRAAARVAASIDGVRFVVAGTGDQQANMARLVNELGLSDRVEFTGFLAGGDVDAAYDNADVFVMPSVSEPFGLTAIEAARRGVPVILSKTSGAAEVLDRGSLKVDFWDVEKMAEMIVAVLGDARLAARLTRDAAREVETLSWDNAAKQCVQSYYDVTAPRGAGDGKRAETADTVLVGTH